MTLFKSLNILEDCIRRRTVEKSGTDKMGIPQVLGTGERPEILSDSVKEEESSETEESMDECEKNSELMGAIGIFGAARKSGVPVSEPTPVEEDLEKARPKPRQAKEEARRKRLKGPSPKERRQASARMAAKKQEERLATGKKKKKAPAKKKKAAPKKKTTSKKPAAKDEGKGASGAGSGQAGRTGKRKRRSVGEFWWAKSGNRPGQDLWTKRESGAIVRANPEERKKYMEEREKRGLKGKVEIETGPPDEHKKRSLEVKKIVEAEGVNEHMTEESKKRVLEKLVAEGIATEKQKKLLKTMIDHLAAMKLSLGKPSRWARTPNQVKRDFLDGMDRSKYKNLKEFNRVKERIEQMSVKDFDAMMRSIEFEEDEDDLREQYGIEGAWKGAPAEKSFDEALEDIIKSMY